jgi:hypothetical protein
LWLKIPLYNKIRSLKRKLEQERKKNAKKQKKYVKSKTHPDKTPQLPELHHTTPEKETFEMLRRHNISPLKTPEVSQELIALKTLAKQVSKAPKSIRVKLLQHATPRKKPRCATRIATHIGVDRHFLFRKRIKKNVKRLQKAREKRAVVDFLKRAENSTMLPGKKDALAKGVQKYSLNDTLSNLFVRFTDENPQIKMSKATFCRQRPRYMKPIIWANRRQCLCVMHENASLKLKAMKVVLRPNVFLNTHTREEIKALLEAVPAEDVHFCEWQKQEINYNGKTYKKM